MSERTSGNGTGRVGAVRRMALLGLMLAAFAVAMLGSMGSVGAEPITVPSDGWTPGNFASSCRAAGGRVVEIDSPGIKYSKCYFPDGSVNKCDWIKKTCTFGFLVRDTGVSVDVSAGTVLEVSDGSTGGTKGGVREQTATRGSGVIFSKNDDDK